MLNEDISSNVLIPIWTDDQFLKLTEVKTASDRSAILPLNQHACVAASMSIPECWPSNSIADLNNHADRALSAWLETETENFEVKSLIWRAARNAEYIKQLLETFLCQAPHKPSGIIALEPLAAGSISLTDTLRRLPLFVLKDYAQKNDLAFKFLAAHNTARAQPEAHLSPKNQNLPPAPISNFILTYGIPDLGHIIANSAKKSGNTLLVTTPDCEAQIAPIRALCQPYTNLFHHHLGSAPLSFPLNLDVPPHAAGSHMTAYYLKSFCAHIEAACKTKILGLQSNLAGLVRHLAPARISFANHDNPYTHALRTTACKADIEVTVFEHSLWPLRQPPFRMKFSKNLRGQHVYYTRSAVAHRQCSHDTSNLNPTLLAWSTLQVNPSRVRLHQTKRQFDALRRGLTIGCVLTTGQAHIAPDISPLSAFDNVSHLIAEILVQRPHTHIALRLRDTQDRVELLLRHISDRIGPALVNQVNMSHQSSEPFNTFVKQCHRIVEAGTPTSATYEAFAYKVPAYRIAQNAGDEPRFKDRPLAIIDMENNATLAVEALLAPDQSTLIKLQTEFLKDETTPSLKNPN